ncbi:hypothetical protein HY605_01350 [Candidatus Peregrinibacteria bacterium]|nr:hypothetical protein [Candidatus Peregrinibacteria bacterium]
MAKALKKLASVTFLTLFLSFSVGFIAYAADAPPDFEDISVEKSDNPEAPSDSDDDDGPPVLKLGGDEDVILEAKAYPKGFNPLTSKTQITYKLSKAVKLDLVITDLSGAEVVKIIDDKELAKGEWYVFWEGTKNNLPTGEIVKIGTYKYVITAKNKSSGDVLDTAEGELNIVYELPQTNPGSPAKTLPPTQNGGSAGAAATISLQKATSGQTSETGPEILIYFLFPVGGLLYSKIRTK